MAKSKGFEAPQSNVRPIAPAILRRKGMGLVEQANQMDGIEGNLIDAWRDYVTAQAALANHVDQAKAARLFDLQVEAHLLVFGEPNG